MQIKTVAAGALAALAAAATPAQAGTFTLGLAATAPAVVGQPMIIDATGSVPPPGEIALPYFLVVAALSPALTPRCPANHWDALQIANAGAGEILDLTAGITAAADGSFANLVGFRPWGAGVVLVCGYISDGADMTLAVASLALEAHEPPPVAARPANVTAPVVSRAANRLNCSAGRWANRPASYAYRWLVGGRVRRGATTSHVAVSPALRGRLVRCSVTASNAAGATTGFSRPLLVR